MNLRKDHCTHKLQSQPQTWVRRSTRGAGLDENASYLNILKLFGCSAEHSGWPYLGVLLLFKAGIQLLSLSPPAGTLARGARSRPNPLSGHGTGSGISTGRRGVLPREAREGTSARVLVVVVARGPAAVLVGWKPDEIYTKSPRLRTLILTRELEP